MKIEDFDKIREMLDSAVGACHARITLVLVGKELAPKGRDYAQVYVVLNNQKGTKKKGLVKDIVKLMEGNREKSLDEFVQRVKVSDAGDFIQVWLDKEDEKPKKRRSKKPRKRIKPTDKEYWTLQERRWFKGDIVITDPCYIEKFCTVSEYTAMMTSTTYYGDWGCTVFRSSVGRPGLLRRDADIVGEFCADSGQVCVTPLKDITMANQAEAWLAEHPWCGTIIRGFTGYVTFMTHTTRMRTKHKDENGKTICYNDIELRVRGEGDVGGKAFAFESVQTSL